MSGFSTLTRPMRAAAILSLTLTLGLLSVSGARAANPDADPLRQTEGVGRILLPVDRTLTLTDGAPSTLLTLAIPPGLTPVRVNARLTSSLKRIAEVTSIPQPSNTLRTKTTVTPVGATSTALHAPLDQAKIVDGSVTLALDIVDAPQQGWCGVLDPGTVSIDEIVLELAGTATPPTTVADFMSPSVTTVRVVIPDKPDSALLDAGLNAVASLTQVMATDASVRLFTESQAAALPVLNPIWGRVVTIDPSSAPEVVTSVAAESGLPPVLALAGVASALPQAAGALGSKFISLADAAKTQGLTETVSVDAALVHPLVDFGAPESIALTGYGRATQAVVIPQAAFGGPIDQITFNLVGNRTAIPSDVLASVNVYWNDFLEASQTFDGETTALDLPVNVAASRMRSVNSLRIDFTAVPRQGACQGPVGQLPVGLYVDGVATKVTGHRGEALAAGFARFPQVLAGQLPVSFGSQLDVSTEATAAGDIVSSLQRVNPRRLTVAVLSSADFISECSTGLFIGANADDAAKLGAPLRLADFRSVEGTSLDFGVKVDQPAAVLEAFSRSTCNVLMLGSWAPSGQEMQEAELALKVAQYAVANEFGWLGMSADLLVGLPSSDEPVQLSTNEVIPQPEVTEEYRPYGLWFAIAFGILVLIGLIGAWRRRRRSMAIRRYLEAEMAADAALAGAEQDSAAESDS